MAREQGEDRYTRRLAARRASTQPNIAQQKTLDGRDGQISARMKLDGSTPMEGPLRLSSDSPPDIRSAAAPTGWVNDRIQEHGHSQYVTNAEFNQFSRKVENSRTGENGGGQHTHATISFTPFVNYPKEVRREMLRYRADLEAVLESGNLSYYETVMAKNTLISLRLRQDYRDFDAYERERRLDDPEWAEWADNYKRVFGIDEYGEEQRPDYRAYPELGVRMDPYQGIAPLDNST